MNFFLIVNSKFLKQGALILITAFFTAWILYIQTMVQIPVFSTKEGPKAVYKGEKDIALTFNIGWGDEKAEPILDELKKQGVKSATFFLAGSWAERHPDLVQRITKEGYEIGILGYDYVDYSEIEESKIRQDLSKAQVAFKKLNVNEIKLVRSPTGHFDKKTLSVVQRYGFTLVHWSIDSKDWTNPGVKSIVNNIANAEKGDILLFHASDSAKQTKDALPNIIESLNRKDLKLVSVSEMIANGKAQTEAIP